MSSSDTKKLDDLAKQVWREAVLDDAEKERVDRARRIMSNSVLWLRQAPHKCGPRGIPNVQPPNQRQTRRDSRRKGGSK